jgi:hypothetical protein
MPRTRFKFALSFLLAIPTLAPAQTIQTDLMKEKLAPLVKMRQAALQTVLMQEEIKQKLEERLAKTAAGTP